MKALNNITIMLALLMTFNTVGASKANAGEGDGVGAVVKEILIKGSVDSKNLFLVLGFEKSTKHLKKKMKDAVDIENLKDIGGDILDLPKNIDLSDIKEHTMEAAKFSKKNAKNIINAPYKSLKKIPGAFSVSLENGREAYYETENHMAASIKYAGHAVWASTKAGYYLVIEAPALAITHLAATALAVPASLALDGINTGIKILWDGTKIGFKIGGHLINGLLSGVSALSALAYSGLSTGVAITATMSAVGAIAIFNGVKWIVTRPAYLINPARVDFNTNIDGNKLADFANELIARAGKDEDFLKLGVNTGFVKSKLNEFDGSITFYSNSRGSMKKAVVMKLKVKKGKVSVYAYVKYGQTKALYKAFRKNGGEKTSKRKFRKSLKPGLLNVITNTANAL